LFQEEEEEEQPVLLAIVTTSAAAIACAVGRIYIPVASRVAFRGHRQERVVSLFGISGVGKTATIIPITVVIVGRMITLTTS